MKVIDQSKTKIVKWIFFSVTISVFMMLSCKDDKPQEIITFDELTGAKLDGNQEDTLTLQTEDEPTKGVFDLFVESQLEIYDTSSQRQIHTLDRFGYTNKNKITFTGKQEVPYGKSSMVIPVAHLYYYSFSDSVKTKNAFYNWLDCYGKDCNAVVLNEDIASVKTPPMFTVVYDTVIVAVEYFCEHAKNDWKSFQDGIISTFGKNYRHRIDVACGGPLKWIPPTKN